MRFEFIRSAEGLGFEIRIRIGSKLELRQRLASGFVTRIGARVRDGGEN